MANRVAQEAFNHLVGDLKATHGDNLASVVLYGSAATGDFVQIESDYNLLIALHRITPEDLRQAQAPMREWQRLGHPLPVYFTLAELHDAAIQLRRDSSGTIFRLVRFRIGDQELVFFSMVAAFGTPLDITVDELALELFFPADPATAAFLASHRT